MPDWPEILERDGPAVWRTAYRLLNHHADADECFQEAFLAAVEVSRRQPVRSWRALLQRLATTRAMDRLRQRCRRRSHEQSADWSTVAGSDLSPAQSSENAELAGRLRDALAHLPPRQAEVFSLFALDDWTYREIAQQLSLSVDAVGVLLHRARQRLRQRLASDWEQMRPREDRS
jgi:RNA polymerase sigma-70 factor (ECF subfamily)